MTPTLARLAELKEFWALTPEEQQQLVHEAFAQDIPEYGRLSPVDQQTLTSEWLQQKPDTGGGFLDRLGHSAIAGVASGSEAFAKTASGLLSLPSKIAGWVGAEGVADAIDPSSWAQAPEKKFAAWAEENQAQGDQGFVGEATKALTSAPGYMAKFGLEMLGGGKLSWPLKIARGIGQVGGIELAARLGHGDPLGEAATGAATDAAMVGAFGGLGKAVQPITKPLARGLAHMAGTAGVAGITEIPAVARGERTVGQAAGAAVGMALLAGHGEYKTVKGLQARKAELQKPIKDGGEGMTLDYAAKVTELERLGKFDEAKAAILEHRAQRAPEAPVEAPPPVVEETQAPAETPTAPEAVVQEPTAAQEPPPGHWPHGTHQAEAPEEAEAPRPGSEAAHRR